MTVVGRTSWSAFFIREARQQARALAEAWPGLVCLVALILAMLLVDVAKW